MTRIYLTPSEPPKVVFFPAADPFVDLVFAEGTTVLSVTFRTLDELTAWLADATLQADKLQAEQSAAEDLAASRERTHSVPCRSCQRPTFDPLARCERCRWKDEQLRQADALYDRDHGIAAGA